MKKQDRDRKEREEINRKQDEWHQVDQAIQRQQEASDYLFNQVGGLLEALAMYWQKNPGMMRDIGRQQEELRCLKAENHQHYEETKERVIKEKRTLLERENQFDENERWAKREEG